MGWSWGGHLIPLPPSLAYPSFIGLPSRMPYAPPVLSCLAPASCPSPHTPACWGQGSAAGQEAGLRVEGPGVCGRAGRVQGAGFRVQGLAFSVGVRVHAYHTSPVVGCKGASGFIIKGSGFRVQGSGLRAQWLGARGHPASSLRAQVFPYHTPPPPFLPGLM